jgi:hypothetical protein
MGQMADFDKQRYKLLLLQKLHEILTKKSICKRKFEEIETLDESIKMNSAGNRL